LLEDAGLGLEGPRSNPPGHRQKPAPAPLWGPSLKMSLVPLPCCHASQGVPAASGVSAAPGNPRGADSASRPREVYLPRRWPKPTTRAFSASFETSTNHELLDGRLLAQIMPAEPGTRDTVALNMRVDPPGPLLARSGCPLGIAGPILMMVRPPPCVGSASPPGGARSGRSPAAKKPPPRTWPPPGCPLHYGRASFSVVPLSAITRNPSCGATPPPSAIVIHVAPMDAADPELPPQPATRCTPIGPHLPCWSSAFPAEHAPPRTGPPAIGCPRQGLSLSQQKQPARCTLPAQPREGLARVCQRGAANTKPSWSSAKTMASRPCPFHGSQRRERSRVGPHGAGDQGGPLAVECAVTL